MVLSYIITPPKICNTWNICYAFGYKIYRAGAAVGHVELGSRSFWPSKHYEVLGMFYCAEADGDVSYKPPKTLLLPFEVHTSLENPILYITAFF